MSRPCLPVDDSDPIARQRALKAQAEPYSWSYDEFEGIAAAPEVPHHEHPQASWALRVAEVILDIIVNAAHVEKDAELADANHPKHRELFELVSNIRKGGLHLAFERLQDFVQGDTLKHLPASSMAEFDGLYHSISRPEIADAFSSDLNFARMRVAGPNPMEIRRIRHLDDRFPVSEAQFERAIESLAAQGVKTGNDSLAKALDEGRAFLTDYAALDGAVGGNFPRGPKETCAPLGLFITTEADRTLVPIAIQCAQRPSADSPIFTPADGWAWRMAKTSMTVADGNLHQAVRHLAHTHLVLGPFRIASKMALAPQHPVARLLDPHFEGILYINDAANNQLMAPQGGVDAVMVLGIEDSRSVVSEAVKGWDFHGAKIHQDLASRDLLDEEALPDFPYRDDGLLVWGAIQDWVESFVRVYYQSDDDVVSDTELQDFFRIVQSQDGGRINSVGTVSNIRGLVEALTQVIFTGSAQHAAVNFPQLPIMSYAPAYPLCAYGRPPGRSPVTEADYLAMLPARDMAQYQSTLGYLLGNVHHTKLGHYHEQFWSHFAGDHRLNTALSAFQARLVGIETLITERNRSRTPYQYLLPSQIPQSINI